MGTKKITAHETVESNLYKKILNSKAKIGLIGIGYVGQALGESSAKSGYSVIGYGRSKRNFQKVLDYSLANFIPTDNIDDIATSDIICICVPTPVFSDKTPDYSPLKEALVMITQFLKKGQLITIESSVAPGTTRNLALPILETTSLKVEKDFFLAFSPERIDPGNKEYTFYRIPKIVSGIGKKSHRLALEFYSNVVKDVVEVSSVETAEMAKVFENSFRLVNISLVNEVADYTRELGIDIHEVIKAAATKPLGFLSHYPGPGAGGHCIPVDPYYLLQDAKKRGINLTLIEKAGAINNYQPRKVVRQAMDIINTTNGIKKTHKVLLLGLTYKENVDDIRESPALEVFKLLVEKGIHVAFHDPFITNYNNTQRVLLSSKSVFRFDLIIILTPHSIYNYRKIAELGLPILDTRNVYPQDSSPNIFKLNKKVGYSKDQIKPFDAFPQ